MRSGEWISKAEQRGGADGYPGATSRLTERSAQTLFSFPPTFMRCKLATRFRRGWYSCIILVQASHKRTWGVSRTGTRPRGDFARNSGDLLSVGWLNSGTSIATPLYSAAIRTLKARKLAGFVQSFCGDREARNRSICGLM